jgi:hypothetical protein
LLDENGEDEFALEFFEISGHRIPHRNGKIERRFQTSYDIVID